MLPTVRGVPWWGAVLVALVPTVIGAVVDGSGQPEVANTYRVLYFIGCVAAVLLVRRRSLFTAVTQPPLVAFGVAIVFYLAKVGTGGGLKNLIIDVLLPIAKLFPLMAWTFVAVLVLGLGRWFLTRSDADKAPKRSAKRRADRSAGSTRARTSRSATTGSGTRSRARAADTRREDDADAPRRSRSREAAPTKRAPDGVGRGSRRSTDDATRAQPPTRRRVDTPAGSREPLRSAMPRDRDDLPREPRPRPSGHRRSADGLPAEPVRDQPGGRLPPRRPRPDPFDDLRPPSAPRARYRGVNP